MIDKIAKEGLISLNLISSHHIEFTNRLLGCWQEKVFCYGDTNTLTTRQFDQRGGYSECRSFS